MKYAIVVAVLVSFCCLSGRAQSGLDGWMRIESDDGQFSVEVPKEYKFVAYKNGFSLSHFGTGGGSFDLGEAKYLTSYVNGTLLAVESYKGSKGAAGEMQEQDALHKTKPEKTTIKDHGVPIRQLSWRVGNTVVFRQYFGLKDRIYILTAASRRGTTPDMTRYLDSVQFADKPAGVVASSNIKFSQLKISYVKLDVNPAASLPVPAKGGPPAVKSPNDGENLEILLKPAPGFTEKARSSGAAGTIAVRVTFSEDGWVPQIVVLRALPDGLLNQALFSVMRMKFLPREKDNKPQTVVRVVEYSFSIY
ncbi:MAG: energy transducer TonB [Acidobacteriota bacterium]